MSKILTEFAFLALLGAGLGFGFLIAVLDAAGGM